MTMPAQGLKWYLRAALCHFLFKILRGYLQRRRMLEVLKDVPDIKAPYNPIMGYTMDFAGHMHSLNHWRMKVTEGQPVSKMALAIWGPVVFVIVRRPEDVKHVLKDAFHKYSKPEPQDDMFWFYFHKWLGEGIFSLPHGVGAKDGGKKWERQRKVAANIFTRSNMNGLMNEVFRENAEHAITAIRPGETMDLQSVFFNFTMDSIMSVFFGEKSNSLHGQTSEYARAYDVAHRALTKFFFSNMPLNSMIELLPFPFGNLGGLVDVVHRKLNPDWQELMAAKKVLDREALRIIEQAYNDPNLTKRSDLLALYMNDPDIKAMPKDQMFVYLRDTVLNFVIAGRDTTACTLTWMFFILCTHPEIQAEIQAEIDEKLPESEPLGVKNLSPTNVPKLHALLFEALRLYPPVPTDEKMCMEDDELPDGTKIPKGTHLNFVPYSQGRDPLLWKDPEKVDLSRWIPFKSPPPHEFPVFQAGPRICLGMDMAIYEAKICAASLLREYSFALAPGEADKITYSLMITMSLCNNKEQTSHELNVIPTRRVKKA